MEERFLDLARRGRCEWWRFVLALLLVALLWQILGAVPFIGLVVWSQLDGDPATYPDASAMGVRGINPLINFAAFGFMEWVFLLGVILAVRVVHQRPILTLLTPRPRLDWRRLGWGFGVFTALSAISAAAEALLYPGRYQFVFSFSEFLPSALLVVCVIPAQAATEELFFRAYLMQALARITGRPWFCAGLSGLLFMLPHLFNPEMKAGHLLMALYYFSVGLFLAIVTLRNNSLEPAIGIHTAMNLFTALVANYSTSVIPTKSIFLVTHLSAGYGLVSFYAMGAVFLLTPFRRRELTSPSGPPVQ